MTKDPFWSTFGDVLRYRKTLAIAVAGAAINAICFGGGLAMTYPMFKLFFGDKEDTAEGHPIKTLVETELPDWIGQPLVSVIPEDLFQSFVAAMGLILVLSVVGSIGRFLHQYLTLTIAEHVAMRWRSRLFARLVDAPLSQLRQSEASDRASRIIVDTKELARGHIAVFGKALLEAFKVVTFITFALVVDWRLTTIFLMSVIGIAFMLRHVGKVIRRASRGALKAQGNILKHLTATLSSIPVIKAYSASGYERRRFHVISRSFYTQMMRMRIARAFASPVTELLATVGIMLAAIVAAWWVFNQGLDSAAVLTVLLLLGTAASSIKPLTGLHNQVKASDAAARRILEAANDPVEPIAPAIRMQSPRLPRHAGSIRFEQVSFQYHPDADPALVDINLNVSFGQTVAIVGTNGAGKSTLLNLLPRLIDPTQGRVVVDGHDISGTNLRSVREQIAVVAQTPVLFEGTIAENIAYANTTTPMEKIVEAATRAQAHRFISDLPGGYEHTLGEGGTGLSGGQAQRICIARAILRDPAILILDEATSQIDAESEARIAAALAELRQGRTTFIIAHRLSTVVDSDLIVVMDQGRIVDQGTHAELLRSSPLYQSLTRHQLQPPAA